MFSGGQIKGTLGMNGLIKLPNPCISKNNYLRSDAVTCPLITTSNIFKLLQKFSKIVLFSLKMQFQHDFGHYPRNILKMRKGTELSLFCIFLNISFFSYSRGFYLFGRFVILQVDMCKGLMILLCHFLWCFYRNIQVGC